MLLSLKFAEKRFDQIWLQTFWGRGLRREGDLHEGNYGTHSLGSVYHPGVVAEIEHAHRCDEDREREPGGGG